MTPLAPAHIRCLALVGHGGAGKTTLAEALLAHAGAIAARGSVEKGNTVCDFDAQEKSAGHSLHSALTHFRLGDVALHLIDTPGYPDFAGQALAALAAVDAVVAVVNAQTGIELATERMLKAAQARGLARFIVINKIDAENLDLPALVSAIRSRFGTECLLLDLPSADRREVVDLLADSQGGSDIDSAEHAHRALIDQLVEEDESLLARYLDDGRDPSPDELHAPFEAALRAGHLVPILFTSARSGAGVAQLARVLAALAPNPAEGNPPLFERRAPGQATQSFRATPDPAAHVLAHVFKLVADPYQGRVSIFRVHQGTVRKDAQLFIGDGRKPFKVSHLYRLQGKDYVEVEALLPGELGAVAKVDEIEFGAVLHDSHDEDHIALRAPDFPRPMQGLAVETRRRGDEQRLFDILHKLELEDPCFRVERHPTTHETVIRGLGEMHLRYKLERMASQYRMELDTRAPSVPYRETVSRSAEGHCRHKKQSGGAGQFGEVFLRVEPLPRGSGIEFVDSVKGGAIPGVFMPAVEKGVRQALADGVAAGYPVEDVRIVIHDGKTHPVDGKEVAFFAAGRKAAIDALRQAEPLVLEPIVAMTVQAPAAAIGDITGDLASRRGHVTGTQTGAAGVEIQGEVPLAEIGDYASRLKSITGGQGSFGIDFARYAAVPPGVQKRLCENFRLKDEDD